MMKKRLLLTIFALAACFQAIAAWDLGIAWIERTEKYPNPKDADGSWNRPAPGDTLHWTANVYSNSEDETGEVTAYLKWIVNTKLEAVHTQTFAKAVGIYQDTFTWTVPENYTYDFTRPLTNKLSVVMSYKDAVRDNNRSNDSKEIFLDAMTFIVKAYTNTFLKYTVKGSNPKSFYDNLEDTIEFMHGRYAAMTYPLAPYGIIDRYRVDHVELSYTNRDVNTFLGNENYYTTLFYSEDTPGGYYGNPYDWIGQTFLWYGNGVFSTMGHGALCHETGHSFCFPDTYRFNMSAENNKVFGEAYTCAWADPKGKEDIMRYCYNGTKDVFTELECATINLHAGEQRRYPPEMHNGKKGWMFSLLPTNICVKVFGEGGREIFGATIDIYRGTGSGYELAFGNTRPSYTLTYDQGAKFKPSYSYDNNNLYANSFIFKLPGEDKSNYKIIDSLRLNYEFLKGQTDTAYFYFTNTAYKVAEPTSIVIGDGSDITYAHENVLHLTYPENAAKIRWANSEGDLSSAEWLDISDDIEIFLDKNGKQSLYFQILSSDFMLSDVYVKEIIVAADWDFGLAWLERTPKYGIGKYDIGSTYRPKPGDRLTWTANIYCNTSLTNDPIDVVVDWYVNTKKEASHTNSFRVVRDLYQDDFHWTMPDTYVYDFTKPLTNIVRAVISYPEGYVDNNVSNNVLDVYMDALSFGVTVVNSTFDKYTKSSKKSFYDHMNDTINYMNAQYARAKSVLAPYGIIDRYRVGYLKRQDSEYFPLNPADSTNCTTQLVFNEGGSMGAFFNAPYYWIGQTFASGIFDMAGHGALCHESGHSLQLPDTYRFDLSEENNKVNGKAWGCKWMDPEGMQDIMRFCYDGWGDIFCGVGPAAANLQAGVYRRSPPEIYSNEFCYSVGWMFQYLPTSIVVRVYHTDGREVDQLPIQIYRGGGEGYYMQFPDSHYEWRKIYQKGGIRFEPNCRYDNAKIFENCFMISLRCTGTPFDILDVLRLNHLCMLQNSTNTVVFSYTNDFRTAEISDLKLNDGASETLSRDVTLTLAADNATRKARWAYSEEELEETEWEDSFTEKSIMLPEEEKKYTIYAQVLSRDFVPSYTESAEITLVPEPTGMMGIFLLISLALRARFFRH